ncbi:hypothetical protein RCO28_12485 [Streptomyces sp. LHD-70]|uniref:hypothetical protein n=1 Tax=Streptomyces sp. LHD-70 TaxID=3072140 RepID=UPI00280D5E8B|nr:hypothetical protein [Streptomyces sp. LHD-70]MDQ8703299.1 hypothetical protein [Streptomyces sp. LHD-70]
MSVPAIESWTPRELEDATKFNERISDVHRFLQNPPAARMIGLKRKDMPKDAYSVIPFFPLGTEGAPLTSYETWPGMVPTFKADWTMGRDTAWQFVVPIDGRYRITLNGAFNTQASTGDLRHSLWVDIGVNMTTGTGDAIAAAAVDTFSPSQSTSYTMCGGHSTVQKLTAGSKVQFAAKCLESTFGWANEEVSLQYKWGSFAEIRWVGTI